MSDRPKDPWGSAGDDNAGSGGQGGGAGDNGGAGSGKGSGPRNPWAVPPVRKAPGPSALDEFLRRTRPQRPGGGGPGGGLPAPQIWAAGAALLVLLWVLVTSIHPIAPGQRGVVTRFGSYAGELDPGWQMTLPAPIDDVQVIDTTYKTESFPDESAMRAVIATVSLNQALGAGQNEIANRVQDEMQHILDGYHSGIRIESVSLSKAAAPAKLAEAFNEVTAAQQGANTNRNNAETYAQQKLAGAQGDTAEFDQWYGQYKLAPEVTKRRLYYETMEAVLARNNKTVVETPNAIPYLQLPGAQKLPDQADKPAATAGAPVTITSGNGSAGQ
jgi:modulator of FtsH protease HflK